VEADTIEAHLAGVAANVVLSNFVPRVDYNGDEAWLRDLELSKRLLSHTDSLHAGEIHIYAIELDESNFLVRFEGSEVLSVEWRNP
jgi:hypothetical protein